ncbi:MAG: hypothetical protein JXC32_19495, partial [Anaerolineae bacterium]|nr:hypothetical protein [Anaerolineae bacterium]
AIGDRAATRVAGADPPFLWITRDTLQFNDDSECQLDVAVLARATAAEDRHTNHGLSIYCWTQMRWG